MIDLQVLEDYYGSIKNRIPGINKVIPVTIDEDMSQYIASITTEELPVLFWIVPVANSLSDNFDNIKEKTICVLFIMDKYDNQRVKAYQIIKSLQPLMESIKDSIVDDASNGCSAIADIDLKSLSTIPESGLYNSLAGWSLGFTLKD